MKNFNLGFHKPKKDQCYTCIAFKHMTPEQSKAKAAQSEHLINKKNRKRHERDL